LIANLVGYVNILPLLTEYVFLVLCQVIYDAGSDSTEKCWLMFYKCVCTIHIWLQMLMHCA